MPSPAPAEPRAAGFFIALAVIAGSVIGAVFRQPSLGFVIGLGVGVAIAIAVWLGSRRG